MGKTKSRETGMSPGMMAVSLCVVFGVMLLIIVLAMMAMGVFNAPKPQNGQLPGKKLGKTESGSAMPEHKIEEVDDDIPDLPEEEDEEDNEKMTSAEKKAEKEEEEKIAKELKKKNGVIGEDFESQRAELQKIYENVTSNYGVKGDKNTQKSAYSWDKFKKDLKWIRLHSYWKMDFANNLSAWRSDHNKWNKTTQRTKMRRSIKDKVRQITNGALVKPNATKQDLDRILWIKDTSGIPSLIRDILNQGEMLHKKKMYHIPLFKESRRNEWCQFWSYCQNVNELYLALNNEPASDFVDPKKLHSTSIRGTNDHQVKWYQTKMGDFVWRENHMPHNRGLRARITLPNGKLDKTQITDLKRGSWFEYLKARKNAADDTAHYDSWNRRDTMGAILAGAAFALPFGFGYMMPVYAGFSRILGLGACLAVVVYWFGARLRRWFYSDANY